MSAILVNKLSKVASNLSILYVEHEPSIKKKITDTLQKFFAEVRVETNEADGLLAYYEKNYDIVLTDLTLSKGCGIVMCNTIREKNPKQKIIVMTTYQNIGYILEAIKLSADGYILKPIENSNFFDTLYKVCDAIKDSKELKLYHKNLEELVLTDMTAFFGAKNVAKRSVCNTSKSRAAKTPIRRHSRESANLVASQIM